MGRLLSATQEIIGEKIFKHLVKFMGDVKFNRTITAYSPVPGEPSLGTLHMLSSPTAWNALASGTATSFTDVNVSSLIPVGAKAVLLAGEVVGRGNGAYIYYLLCVRKNGSSAAYSYCPTIGGGVSASNNGNDYVTDGMLTVEVDSGRIFEYMIFTNSGTKSANIAVLGYYM